MFVHLLQVKQSCMYVYASLGRGSKSEGGGDFGHDTGDGPLGTDVSLKVCVRRGCAEHCHHSGRVAVRVSGLAVE